MKKLIAIFVGVAYAAVAAAQTDQAQPTQIKETQTTIQVQPETTPSVTTQTRVEQTTPGGRNVQTSKEYVEMVDGKLYRYKEGTSTVVTTTPTYTFGEVVFGTDGFVTLKDGSRITLREGDRITHDGLLIRSTDKARINPPNEMKK